MAAGPKPIAELTAAINTMPRAKVISSTDNYLHAEFTSLLFRFVDDVEFLVDPENKVIHCRSASRTVGFRRASRERRSAAGDTRRRRA